MIEATLTQSYIMTFALLLIAAPSLVGIVSPLITPVIRGLEKTRLEKLHRLQEEARKLAKAKDDKELKEAKKKLKNAAEEYEKIKGMTRYLDFSIGIGLIVAGICLLALLNLLTSSAINYQLLLGVALSGFFLESFLLLLVVLFHVISIRKKVIEELSVSRKPAEKLEIIPDDEIIITS